MLHHAAEEIGALLLPVDAGKGLLQRGDHVVLDAIGAGSGVALDDQRFQALDHHAAAHLDGTGHTEPVGHRRGVHAPGLQHRCEFRGARAAKQHGHANTVGRHGRHHTRFDIGAACGVDQPCRSLLGAGGCGVEVEEHRARPQVARRFLGHRQRVRGRDGGDDQVRLRAKRLHGRTGCHLCLGSMRHGRRCVLGLRELQVPGADLCQRRPQPGREDAAHLAITHQTQTFEFHQPASCLCAQSIIAAVFSRAG